MSIQDELQALLDASDDDFLQARTVVEWAKSHPTSALYNAPEFMGWDLNKLAYEHLLHGARKLIEIHLIRIDGTPRVVSLTLDRHRPGGGYRRLDDVLANKRLHDILLHDALTELERVQFKYTMLKELKGTWEEVEKVRRRAERRAKKGGAERRASA